MAAHAWDVNIFIWTSRKLVDHGTNDRVMVHGKGTRADGRRSGIYVRLCEIVGSGVSRLFGPLGLMSFFVERSASAASSAGGAASVIALLAIVNFLNLLLCV